MSHFGKPRMQKTYIVKKDGKYLQRELNGKGYEWIDEQKYVNGFFEMKSLLRFVEKFNIEDYEIVNDEIECIDVFF
jgi:hypothetical protein